MKYCLLLILFFASCKEKEIKTVVVQKTSNEIEKPKTDQVVQQNFDILKYLLDEEIGKEKPEEIDYKNYSVSFDNEGDFYSVSFQKIASEDFNNDGIQDYIIERNSEGMLGGNANTNSEMVYIIMGKDDKIQDKYKILTYAPFSYNVLTDIAYKDRMLKITATQNYRAYSKLVDEVESTGLSFVYQNNNVYEKSYLSDCELAKWKNKKIFNNASEVQRTIDLHNYTEVLKEKYKGEDFEYTAELSGCDNLNLVIEGDFTTKDFSKKSIDAKRNEFLNFLVKNSTLSRDLAVVQISFKNISAPVDYITQGDLSFNIFTNKHKDKINFRLVLNKDQNKNQTENWEITTRKK